MAQIIEFNIPAFIVDQESMNISSGNLCFCCLSQNKTMIRLANCEHNGFLQEYYTIADPKVLVCHICHNMLKKICSFKKQVAESSRFINSKLQTLRKTNQLFNLQQTDTMVSFNVTKTEDPECNIKVKLEREDTGFDIEVKSELSNQEALETKSELSNQEALETKSELSNQEALETKTEIQDDTPLEQIKKGVEMVEIYIGKIGVFVMSEEEFKEERERESMKESYLKLPFKCESCIKGFEFENTLKKHNNMLHNTSKGKYVCNICKVVLGSESAYKKHKLRHLKRFVCIACGERAAEINSITKHFNQQHGEVCGAITTKFECDQCEFITHSHNVLRYHRGKHKNPQCNTCGKRFANSSSLKAHVNTVHKGITRHFACSSCDKSYKTRSGLVKHTEKAHVTRDDAQGAYCEKCRTHYADKASLVQHLKRHSAHVTDEDKKYACQECDAKFVTRFSLQNHIDWTHRKYLKFKCNKCSKAFKSAGTLKRHREFVHEKKRPPKDKVCDYCGRAFSMTKILVSHIRTHTGERPLKCTHCSATFAHAASLYNHNKLLHNKI